MNLGEWLGIAVLAIAVGIIFGIIGYGMLHTLQATFHDQPLMEEFCKENGMDLYWQTDGSSCLERSEETLTYYPIKHLDGKIYWVKGDRNV